MLWVEDLEVSGTAPTVDDEEIMGDGDVGGRITPSERRVVVLLSERDQILHARRVWGYLTRKKEAKEDKGEEGRKPIGSAQDGKLIDVDDADVDPPPPSTDGPSVNGDAAEADKVEDEGDEGRDPKPGETYKNGNLEVMWFEGIDHAQVFDLPQRKRLLDAVKRIIDGA